MGMERSQLPPEKVDALLVELCVEFGFCLPPGANKRLRSSPPTSVERFADVIFEYEGLDPKSAQHGKLRKAIVERIAQYFERATQEQEPTL
jgi:hypothetical protein